MKERCRPKVSGSIRIPGIIFRIEEISPSPRILRRRYSMQYWLFQTGQPADNSTTAAHEYVHTLAWIIRKTWISWNGSTRYYVSSGTVCDPMYQYDPGGRPFKPGGQSILLPGKFWVRYWSPSTHKLSWNDKGFAVLGDFSSILSQ